jgi:hypothetical protein
MPTDSELITIGPTSPIADYAGKTRPAASELDTAVTTVTNGIFDGDADAAGNKVTNLGGLVIGYKTTKEIWIGIRTSGKAGCGSKDDPFDGSSLSKMNTLLRNYAAISGSVIHLMDGQFDFSGLHYNGHTLSPKCQIVGMGMGVTILKLSASVALTINSSMSGITGDSTVDGDGQYIGELTLDLNFPAMIAALGTSTPHFALNGVGMAGNNNLIENVEVINGYGFTGGGLNYEHFGLLSGGVLGDTTSFNNRIIGCKARLVQGNYGSAIAVTHDASVGYANANVGGVIRDCAVEDYDAGGTSIFHALTLTGNGVIDSCTCKNTQAGIYAEDGKDVKITNNSLYVTQEGIHLNPTDDRDIINPTIMGNTIRINDDEVRAWGITFSAIDAAGTKTRSGRIIGNTVQLVVTGNTPAGIGNRNGIFLSVDGYEALFGNTGHVVIGNTIGTEFANNVPADAYVNGNRDFEGGMIGDLMDHSPPAVSTATFGALRSKGTRTIAGGSWLQAITMSSYTIVNGDTLEVSIMVATGSKSGQVLMNLRDSGPSALGINTVRDQVGHLGYADLTDFATGQFFTRVFDLTPIVGSAAVYFYFGGGGSDEGGALAATGLSTYYFKNVRIVGSDGTVRRNIYVDSAPMGTLSATTPTNATGTLGGPYYPTNLPIADPSEAGLLWCDTTADYVVKVSH